MKLKSHASQLIDDTLDINEDDIFVQVFRPEKHECVHGCGVGKHCQEKTASSIYDLTFLMDK